MSATGSQFWRVAALALAGALALTLLWQTFAAGEREPTGLVPHRAPVAALGHRAAAALQQGQPTTAAEARDRLDHDLVWAGRRARNAQNWSDQAELAGLLLSRAQLVGSYQNYVDAGAALQAAFEVAPPGTGPHLDRAAYHLAIHRLPAMAADLEAVERYAIPDDAELSTALGLRGDVFFYGGRYREALSLYRRAQQLMPGTASEFRLANYYAHTGRPDWAEAFLDQADSRIGGPQQQLRAFVEVRRGVLDLDAGRWDAAEVHFRRAEDIFPGYWLTEHELAGVLALRGQHGAALTIYRRAALRDDLPEAWDGAAAAWQALGDAANAATAAQRAGTLWEARLALAPEAAMGHAAQHHLQFGDRARALDLAQRDYALRPFGDSACTLAAALLANDRPADALRALAPTLASEWTTAEPYAWAARAAEMSGDRRRAKRHRRAALAIDPHVFERTAVARGP